MISNIMIMLVFVKNIINSSIHPCIRPRHMVNLKAEMELAMGCSRIKNEYAYSLRKLEELYEISKVQER